MEAVVLLFYTFGLRQMSESYLFWRGASRRLDLSGAVKPRLELRQLCRALLLHLLQIQLKCC
jgi:hypothetical protein